MGFRQWHKFGSPISLSVALIGLCLLAFAGAAKPQAAGGETSQTRAITAPVASQSRVRTYFSEYANDHYLRQRPTWIHGGSDFGWRHLAWRTWGGRRALGRGSFYWIEKEYQQPNIVHEYPINIALDTRKACGARHRLHYLRVVVVFTGEIPPYRTKRRTVRLGCNGGIVY